MSRSDIPSPAAASRDPSSARLPRCCHRLATPRDPADGAAERNERPDPPHQQGSQGGKRNLKPDPFDMSQSHGGGVQNLERRTSWPSEPTMLVSILCCIIFLRIESAGSRGGVQYLASCYLKETVRDIFRLLSVSPEGVKFLSGTGTPLILQLTAEII